MDDPAWIRKIIDKQRDLAQFDRYMTEAELEEFVRYHSSGGSSVSDLIKSLKPEDYCNEHNGNF